MIRVRTLGLALVAMLAISAIAAASASAFENFVANPFPQKFTAGQATKHKFTVEGKAVECNMATFTGEAKAEKQKEVEVNAAYSECTAFAFIGSTVTMNGCKYDLHIIPGTNKGEADVVHCNTGKEIEIAVSNGSGCLITVGEQKGLKEITYGNVEGKNKRKSVEVVIAIKKIKLKSNGLGLGCPKATATEGEYAGSSIAEGETGTLEVV
jgi:hypothetical protein